MIEVVEQDMRLHFSFDDMLRYSGPGSPAGVAIAYQAMLLAFALLDPNAPPARRAITIETAFHGPGARDGFELVTRSLTDGRYLVTSTLERPERGTNVEQFVFRFTYQDRTVTLLVRAAVVSDEFIALARKPERTPQDEARFTAVKQAHADHVLGADPSQIFDVEPD